MVSSQINSPLVSPPNSVENAFGNSPNSSSNDRRIGFFNSVSSALAAQLLNQSSSSGSFFAGNTLGSCSSTKSLTDDVESVVSSPIRTLNTPLRLTEPGLVLQAQTEGHARAQLRSELLNWVSVAASIPEVTNRQEVAAKIISCFHNKQEVLSINAQHITDLPACIGFLSHLRVLDLTNCHSLRSLPNVMDNLFKLRGLNLTNCYNLTALPPTVNALSRHAHLFLSGSGIDLANPLQSRLPNR